MENRRFPGEGRTEASGGCERNEGEGGDLRERARLGRPTCGEGCGHDGAGVQAPGCLQSDRVLCGLGQTLQADPCVLSVQDQLLEGTHTPIKTKTKCNCRLPTTSNMFLV